MSADTACSHPAHDHALHPPAVLEQAAQLFSALADPRRLRLLELLYDGRHCVSELAEETAASMPTVSQRLKVLSQARLVSRAREGKHVYYSLADAHVRQILTEVFDHVSE
jgi:DNA-binding transcriptional ArsR family regulator